MNSKIYDVAVIGGGPAGMMAAGKAAESGASVILIEKNESLGKKLLITGGGRCNVTNAEPSLRLLIDKFGKEGHFLFSVFSRFTNLDTIRFFEEKNMPTKVELEQRVFPQSDQAQSVWGTLVTWMKSTGRVDIAYNSPVLSIEKDVKTGMIRHVVTPSGKIFAKTFIVATGGKARPETGSTGDGFSWMKNLGHTIIEPNPALIPLVSPNTWVKDLQGVSLKDVKVSVTQGNQKMGSRVGKILFTHFGLSGPLILNMSKEIGDLLPHGLVNLEIDLFPSEDPGIVDTKVLAEFEANKNKKIKNIFSEIFPTALLNALLDLAKISPDKEVHSVTKDERARFVEIIKHVPVTISGLLGLDKAIITSGGVDPREIDFKTMQSMLIPNLYIIGDMLNFNRPTGGYSLQICWSTGFVAGGHAAQKVLG